MCLGGPLAGDPGSSGAQQVTHREACAFAVIGQERTILRIVRLRDGVDHWNRQVPAERQPGVAAPSRDDDAVYRPPRHGRHRRAAVGDEFKVVLPMLRDRPLDQSGWPPELVAPVGDERVVVPGVNQDSCDLGWVGPGARLGAFD
jgi:hypothetical protein